MGIFIEDREDLFLIIRGLKSQGKTVVFTNGAFDLLHVGHVRSLGDARSRGDYLVVAVNSDASVRKLKGTGLPVNNLKERVEVLCALTCVDYVTVFNETTADDILSYLKPSIHAKGTDYSEETVPERETVLGYGGQIAIVGDPKKHSTTKIIDKIRNLPGKKAAPAKTVKKAAKPAKKKATKAASKKKAVNKKTAKKTTKKTTRKTAAKGSAKKKKKASATVQKPKTAPPRKKAAKSKNKSMGAY